MSLNNKIGVLGENIAFRYLLNNGYLIYYRNYMVGFDEIDIIGRDSIGILVFFEIKTLRINFNSFLIPEDNFSFFKLNRVVRASQKFAARRGDLVDDELGWQIDLLAISIRPGGRFDLRHYKNV